MSEKSNSITYRPDKPYEEQDPIIINFIEEVKKLMSLWVFGQKKYSDKEAIDLLLSLNKNNVHPMFKTLMLIKFPDWNF